MIKEVHVIISSWNSFYDLCIVYYYDAPKKSFFRSKLPKAISEYIENATCECIDPGEYFVYK